jgi:hypothetical protein
VIVRAIVDAIDLAHSSGADLAGVTVGNTLVVALGASGYKRFRLSAGNLRRGLESLGFVTTDVIGGFIVDYPS